MKQRGSQLASELAAAVVAEIATNPALAAELADALAPHLPERSAGWLAPSDAAAYLGLGSLDALDRMVLAGLPCVQPNGQRGRRYFSRADLDAWMRARPPE